MFLSYTRRVLGFLADTSLIFIVPYYTYKHSKDADIRPFWIFIRETFWPVIWNFYIKTTLVILFFTLLLIIPGLYKAARLSFVNETIFFDNLYKQGQVSSLKGSDKISRGYFWPVLLVCILTFGVLVGFLDYLVPFLMKDYLSFSVLANQVLIFILSFYATCFVSLFYTQFYFELKKQRGEEISC